MPRRAAIALALVGILLAGGPAFALEVVIKDVRTPASVVTIRVDIRDTLPDRFRRLLDEGVVVHLRLQAELWESRPVWDRLVFPAIVRVFRFGRAGSSRDISIGDSAGATTVHATVPNPLPVAIELGRNDRVDASARYYVHVLATLGTLAEREADDVGDAVFGKDTEANGLGSLGRLVFRTAIKLSDYLQSVSAETTSRKTVGAEILKRP